MSRTNHHRPYVRWNIVEVEYLWGWKTEPKGSRPCTWRGSLRLTTPWEWVREPYEHQIGVETWDLRFYAGCKRRPQLIHKSVRIYGHCNRILVAQGVAASASVMWERSYRRQERDYTHEARGVHNAGGDVDELHEPDKKPRSITWDLW